MPPLFHEGSLAGFLEEICQGEALKRSTSYTYFAEKATILKTILGSVEFIVRLAYLLDNFEVLNYLIFIGANSTILQISSQN